MIFTDTETQKDTSAAPIAVCGILEMSKLADIPAEFTEKAQAMMSALTAYHTPEHSNGILKAAVYSMNHNNGVDECNIKENYMKKAHVVTHTHWDREWRYPVWENRQYLVDMMDELLEILDTQP